MSANYKRIIEEYLRKTQGNPLASQSLSPELNDAMLANAQMNTANRSDYLKSLGVKPEYDETNAAILASKPNNSFLASNENVPVESSTLSNKEIIKSNFEASGKIPSSQTSVVPKEEDNGMSVEEAIALQNKQRLIANLGQAGGTIGAAISGIKNDSNFWDSLKQQTGDELKIALKKEEQRNAKQEKELDRQADFRMKSLLAKAAQSKNPAEGLKAASDLRQEYNNLGVTKNTNIILESSNKIKEAAQNDSAAGDLSLIFSYMKILDPGSTVREGEFANAQNAASVPDRIRNIWNRAQTGERLNSNQRQDFLNQAQNLTNAQLNRQKDLDDRYSNLARTYGVDPQIVIDPSLTTIREQALLDKKNKNKKITYGNPWNKYQKQSIAKGE